MSFDVLVGFGLLFLLLIWAIGIQIAPKWHREFLIGIIVVMGMGAFMVVMYTLNS